MNTRFLEAFVWVARLRSFRAVADKLNTTQAGISSRIATLEAQLGVKLFERDRRHVALTYHGTELLPYAERMIELQGRMYGVAGRADLFTGMLRIGVIETVAHTWLPDLLSRFAARYPDVTIELQSDITPRLRDALLHGTLDCAITSEQITPGFIANRRIADFSMRWTASPELAARLPRRLLTFADIAEHPILSFHRESSVYRNIAQHVAGCANPRVSYFSSLAAMTDLVRASFGIAPLPLAVIQHAVAGGQLVPLTVEPVPLPLPLVASVRQEPASPVAEALVSMAQQSCARFVAASRPDIVA